MLCEIKFRSYHKIIMALMLVIINNEVTDSICLLYTYFVSDMFPSTNEMVNKDNHYHLKLVYTAPHPMNIHLLILCMYTVQLTGVSKYHNST